MCGEGGKQYRDHKRQRDKHRSVEDVMHEEMTAPKERLMGTKETQKRKKKENRFCEVVFAVCDDEYRFNAIDDQTVKKISDGVTPITH